MKAPSKSSSLNGSRKPARPVQSSKSTGSSKSVSAAASKLLKPASNAKAKHQQAAPNVSKVNLIKPSSKFQLAPELLVQIHDHMVKARVLEERLIRMYKQSDGYFWIGGPGEEAFNVPLALQIKKGQGINYDYMHLHYRSSAIMSVLGMDPADAMRQMKNTASDPFSGGRNFGNHYSARKWNVVPVSSTIETQYATAIGTGIAQARAKTDSLTIVNGGDAGTAEGEFASCLVWSSRPALPLPIFMIVTNNEWGISTPAAGQHGEKFIHERGTAFGIKNAWVDGNDPEASFLMVREVMEYIRTERKPFLLESRVSRLYGHSSATGCNFVGEEQDCLKTFEAKLENGSILTRKEMDELREKYNQEMIETWKRVREEPLPDPSTIYDHTYYGQKGRYW